MSEIVLEKKRKSQGRNEDRDIIIVSCDYLFFCCCYFVFFLKCIGRVWEWKQPTLGRTAVMLRLALGHALTLLEVHVRAGRGPLALVHRTQARDL